jgi:ATP-dependent helicase/nuclease subunit B
LIGSDALAAGMLYFTLQNPLIVSHGPLAPDLVAKEVLKKLKMKGLLLADPEIISLMDNLVFTSPDLLPVAFKKDGCFTSNSSVISTSQFAILRQHLHRILKAAGEEIMAGVVAIKPYRGQKFASCRYCQFKAICKFDPLLPENNFRLLPSPSEKEIWQSLSQVNTKEI